MYSTSRTYSPVSYDTWDYFMIVGQSNAVGVGLWDGPEMGLPRIGMFCNDYVWRQAYEPTDDRRDQVDTISQDNASIVPGVGQLCHSAWLRAARKVCEPDPSRKVALIPCAKGSTVFQSTNYPNESWHVPSDPLDRTTLFGSALYRAKVAATRGARLKGIWFNGHESSVSINYGGGGENLMATFKADMQAWINAWRYHLQADIPIILGQLVTSDTGTAITPTSATHVSATDTWLNYHLGREYARQIEAENTNVKLVVWNDQALNAADPYHINRAGQDTVGDRVALATRELIYGESVNGTGPRPVSCSVLDANTVELVLSKDIQASTGGTYDGQFRVFTDSGHVVVSAADRIGDSVIWIVTSTSISGAAYVDVTYGQHKRNTLLTDQVKDSDGMPLPGFTLRAT